MVLLGALGYATAAMAAEEMAAPAKPAAVTSQPAPAPAASAPQAASAPAATATQAAPAPATTVHVTHAPAKVPKMLKLEAGKPRPQNMDLRHCLDLKDNKAIAKCAGE